MKRNRTAKEREDSRKVKFLYLLFVPLLVSGCSYHENRPSYFNMLDNEKTTVQNKKSAEKFWSSVRPVSTLSASHYKLGRYYQQQGKYDKSIEEFSKAVRNDNKFCKAYNGIAMSHDALNHCEMAYNSYEQAIQCDPQEAYAYNNYACSRILCGDYEKGLALLLEAVQLSADNSRIKNNIKLAHMLIDRENKPAKHTSQEETVALAAPVSLEPTQNEDDKAGPDSTDEKVGNPGLGLTPNMIDRAAHESVEKDSAESPVPANDLADQAPQMEQAEEIQSFPAADTTAVNKETTEESESSLQNNIAIVSLVAEKTKKISVQDRTALPVNYTNGAAIEVSNGNGVTGMAGRSADYFRSCGFTVRRITNAKYFHVHDSIIFYREGYLQMAEELAKVTPGAQSLEKVDSFGRPSIGVRILLGKDLVNMQFPEGYARSLEWSKLEKSPYISSISNMARPVMY
jgi:tetratricopeptide (TPR) repeat protein